MFPTSYGARLITGWEAFAREMGVSLRAAQDRILPRLDRVNSFYHCDFINTAPSGERHQSEPADVDELTSGGQ
jgi:hypothetical protein